MSINCPLKNIYYLLFINMYYKAKVNNLTPSSTDAPIFAIYRDEKWPSGWMQVEYTEDHDLAWKLTKVVYNTQTQYPKVELWFLRDNGDTVIFKSSLGKTTRSILYKLSQPEKIDNVVLKANWFETTEWEKKTVRYVSVYVDWQKCNIPFEKDDPRVQPTKVEQNGKFYGYDWDKVNEFVINDLIPQIQGKLLNKRSDEPAHVERKNEDPETVLPF